MIRIRWIDDIPRTGNLSDHGILQRPGGERASFGALDIDIDGEDGLVGEHPEISHRSSAVSGGNYGETVGGLRRSILLGGLRKPARGPGILLPFASLDGNARNCCGTRAEVPAVPPVAICDLFRASSSNRRAGMQSKRILGLAYGKLALRLPRRKRLRCYGSGGRAEDDQILSRGLVWRRQERQ